MTMNVAPGVLPGSQAPPRVGTSRKALHTWLLMSLDAIRIDQADLLPLTPTLEHNLVLIRIYGLQDYQSFQVTLPPLRPRSGCTAISSEHIVSQH